MNQRFNDKVVLVTGAGSGLAKAAALGFAEQGASLCLVDIDAQGLEKTRQEIETHGANVMALTRDLGSRDACHDTVAKTVEHFGRLDVLCNIAGIVRMHPVTEVSQQDWDLLTAINMAAPFWLSQAAIPHLIESNGNIVNCASQSSQKGCAYIVPYSMTKGAIVLMTKSMAMEYINAPIRINAVSPGTMANTNMSTGMSIPEGIDPSLFMRYGGIRPASEPDEVASVILFLASDDARAVHGAIYCADGGTTAD